MRKSDSLNDIEAKNSSIVQNGKLSLDNGKYYGKNIIDVQQTNAGDNLKTARKIQKVKEKTKGISEIVTKFAVLAVAGVSGIVGIETLTPSPIQAEISYVEAYDTEVFYNVSLSELADGLKIVLYNDFTNREQKIEEQMTEGVFENLQTNMKYTLVVKHGSKVLAKETLVTKTREETWDEPVEDEPLNEDPTQVPDGEDTGQQDDNQQPNLSDNESGETGNEDSGSSDTNEPTTSDDGSGENVDPTTGREG